MFALVLLPSIVTLAPRAATLPGPYAVTDLGTGQIVRSSGRTDPDTVDDEPRVKISSVSKNEGNNGTTSFAFPLTLSAASDAAVTVNFVTADGYARAPEDYEAKSGSLDFAAGTTSKTITVNVKGDRTREWDEVFYVNLSGAAGAVIQPARGRASFATMTTVNLANRTLRGGDSVGRGDLLEQDDDGPWPSVTSAQNG